MIRIRKINSGVEFQIVLLGGNIPKRVTQRQRDELRRARDWYEWQVKEALLKRGMYMSYYGQTFIQRRFRVSTGPSFAVYELDPWGFATEDEQANATMGNSGSTPTAGRTKILLSYQDPLEKKQNPDNSFTYELCKAF